jgi:hypothetical protein
MALVFTSNSCGLPVKKRVNAATSRCQRHSRGVFRSFYAFPGHYIRILELLFLHMRSLSGISRIMLGLSWSNRRGSAAKVEYSTCCARGLASRWCCVLKNPTWLVRACPKIEFKRQASRAVSTTSESALIPVPVVTCCSCMYIASTFSACVELVQSQSIAVRPMR